VACRSGTGRRWLWKRHAHFAPPSPNRADYVSRRRVFDDGRAPGQHPSGPAAKARPWATPKRLQRNADHQPDFGVKQLPSGCRLRAWKDVAWRPGSQEKRCALGSPPCGFVLPTVMKKRTSHTRKMALDRMAQEEFGATNYWLSTLQLRPH